MIFVGLLIFDDDEKADLAFSIVLFIIALFNLVVLVVTRNKKRKNDYQRDDEEDQEIDEELSQKIKEMSKRGREEAEKLRKYNL